MKILVLSYEYPPIGGGGGVICKNISENLAILGNQVTVLTTAFNAKANGPADIHGAENPEPGDQSNNLNVIRLNSKRKEAFESNPVEMLSWIATTRSYIKSNPGFIDFDLCMAHFVLPGGEVALWLKRKFNLPYVLVSHGHEIPWVHPRQMFLLHLAAYSRIKKVGRESAVLFVQTQMMKSNLDRFMGENQEHKHAIIPNGVDTARFCPDPSKRTDKLRIIFVGRLVSQKDPMTFLRAIRLFCAHTLDFEVHVLGDGRMRRRMERFVRKNRLGGSVKFLGKIAGARMLDEYKSAHLMVAPSLNEGMSISALEALSCGVYVIATRASGFEDMISENVNGEFGSFRKPEELCGRMINFYDRHRFGHLNIISPKPDLLKKLNWPEISKQYHDNFLSFLR